MLFLIVILLAFCGFLYMIFDYIAIYIVLALLGVVLVLIYTQQNKLLYMPGDTYVYQLSNPIDHAISIRKPKRLPSPFLKRITSRESIVIDIGWPDNQRLACQSTRSPAYSKDHDIGYRIPLLKEISHRTSSDVILVGYRGYSDSDGAPSQKGLQHDADAVIDYALQYGAQNKLPVFLYGRSLGGAVSIYISSSEKYKTKIAGLILQNTFTSISDMINAIMPIFKPVKFLLANYWPSIERIPKITKPILFVSSLRDQIVPASQMARLRQNTDPDTFVMEHKLPFGTHNCTWELEKDIYFETLNNFLKHERVSKFQGSGVKVGSSKLAQSSGQL